MDLEIGKKKVVYVGLSGGVDSSVSAALLREATPNNFSKLFGRPTPEGFSGYDVHGVFIKVWQPDFFPCTATEDRLDAMRVCSTLDIPFETLDLEEEYRRDVVDYMVSEYKAGRTPNPDVMCNKSVKFGAFLDYALSQGADFVATGHYAQIADSTRTSRRLDADWHKPKLHLLAGRDPNKDQSYFLWTLTQEQLKHVLFPVGHLKKSEVRNRAENYNLPTAQKKDSQGLCFLGKLDMKEFLNHFITSKRGDVLDEQGNVIGTHDGALLYVLGERHGFTVHKSPGIPYYVMSKDISANTITVAPEGRVKENASQEVELRDLNFIHAVPKVGETFLARSRYRQPLEPLQIVEIEEGYARLRFTKDAPLAPAGQSLVLYREDGEALVCHGGGVLA
jgi:tRNA-specific 2-thiouridylase